jgi:hypothetical protein
MSIRNWRQAGIELLLIVAGVLIALQASEWQQNRADRQLEKEYLQELEVALVGDLALLQRRTEQYREVEAALVRRLDALRSGAEYSKSVDADFGMIFSTRSARLNAGVYESLKSHGLTLISNGALRSEIASVYEQSYQRVADTLENEIRASQGWMTQYRVRYFRDIEYGRNATPLDYAALLEDVEFHNVLDGTIARVRQSQIFNYESASVEVESLIESIREELDQ